MKPYARLSLLALAASPCCLLPAQFSVTAATFIDARQPEVVRLSEIFFRLRLDDGKWARVNVEGCEVFAHHAFTTFANASKAGSPLYVAIYDLQHAPAKSLDKPWEGGVKFLPASEQSTLLTAFNHAIEEENARSGADRLDSVAIANCFISLSGEKRAFPASNSDSGPDGTKAPERPKSISNVLVPLMSARGIYRTEVVAFDTAGHITKATVVTQPIP